MSEIEDLQLEFDSLLCQQSVEKLSEICVYLKVEELVDGKSRSQLVKIIRNVVDNVLLDPKDVDVDIFLRDAISKLTGTPPPLEKSPEEIKAQSRVSDLEGQLRDLQLLQEESENARENILEQLREAKEKISEITHNERVDNSSKVPVSQNRSKSNQASSEATVFRREFKICGQIGEPGQHDKLTYVSLIHQIDSAIENGYSEKEVSDAIIKSISPHSSLRNYILTLPQRTLGKLRSILRVFFQEKTASDLFQAMVTTVQEPKETAQQFLLRLLDARNKVFFATREEHAESEYSSQLVEKSFLKAFESGLRDENLVTNLRPFLRKSQITDEELMRSVNELATKQAERKAKIGTATERYKAAKAQVVNVEKENGSQTPKIQKKGSSNFENQTEKLSAEIQNLKAELAAIKSQVDTPTGSNLPPRFQNRARGRGRSRYNQPGRYGRPMGCRNCQAKGMGEQCRHCFQCGGQGHVRSQCPHYVSQGNLPRLFQGGTE